MLRRPPESTQYTSLSFGKRCIVAFSAVPFVTPLQYTSLAFGKRCRKAGVRPSMGSVGDAYDNALCVGDAYDNALCESFFATLGCELLARRRFTALAEARIAVFSSVEGCYNPARLHSALGYRSPIADEQEETQAAEAHP